MEKERLHEIRRKLFHICLGSILVFTLYFGYIGSRGIFMILVAGGIVSLASKYLRIPVVSWFLDFFDRPEHRKTIPGKGALTFFFGTLLAVKLFDRDVAIAAILILALGDSISHLIGKTYGKMKTPLNRYKNIEGTIAGTVVAGISASFFVLPAQAFIGAAAAMFFELIEIRLNEELLDDNIIVPLIAGTAIHIIRNYQTLLIL